MGRGNVCVTGKYEGLYYIDNDDIHVYCRKDEYSDEPEVALARDLTYKEMVGSDWYFDDVGTMLEQDDIEWRFAEGFTNMYPSFKMVNPERWMDRNRRVILESGLFYVCVEDNQWSLAVELIQKEEPNGFNWMENLQGRLYDKYLEGMKRCLLERLPSIGTYAGAWTSGFLTRDQYFAQNS